MSRPAHVRRPRPEVSIDQEKDRIWVAPCEDGMGHTFRQCDDTPISPKPVCGADTRPGPEKNGVNNTPLCEPCTIWALRWAGSKDPEAEWASMWKESKD